MFVLFNVGPYDSMKHFFEIQVTLRDTLCHKDGEGCAHCAYGHIMARVAEEFLRREDLAGECIFRWAAEVERRWRAVRAAGLN